MRHSRLDSSGMNSYSWCVEHYRTHEQRYNRAQRYVFIAQYSCTCVYMCMHVCEGKKQTPICDEGVASFSEIRKDKGIKLYPVAPQFASCDTFAPTHLAHVAGL